MPLPGLRQVILAASRSATTRRIIERAPISRSVVHRFVSGATVDDAVRATKELQGSGRAVTLDHLGEDTIDAGQAEATVKAYLTLLDHLQQAGLTEGAKAEVSVKLSAVGQTIDEKLALAHATTI